ncbi:MAG: ATP-binding protein [Eubacterium sp.]|nr:ATP-binding protein [Candidatus Colimonas fimequi]
MNNQFRHLKLQIDSLAVFRSVKNDVAVSRLCDLLEALADGKGPEETISIYSSVVECLYPVSSDLGDYVSKLVTEDENFYIKAVAAGITVADEIRRAVDNELSVLQTLAMLDAGTIKEAIGYDDFLPAWTNGTVDIAYDFHLKLNNIMQTGYGIFAKYDFFRLENGVIVPVSHPDYQSLDQLFGYERERNLIMKNTEALVKGTGANNMLLYGDAGTGKSSTIKAVAAHFAPQGLRIIEVKKTQLYQIPGIMEELSLNPLKFVIFIDDLSFSGNDDNFSALKATLEGSISGTSSNVAIYATSNRRHLVKESFADRSGDELHTNDTLQETMSLAARFGLTITFQKPGKDEYLNIVKSLAVEYGIEMDEEELFKKAEAHAIRKHGRSPRTAKQFIELLKIGI